jgi:large subunit ribosomal protein L4
VDNNEIIVVDELKFDAPKTKEMVNLLDKLNAKKKALIVTTEKDENVVKSANNLPNVQTTIVNNLNVYDILKYDSFIITKEAVKKVEEVYA